MLALNIDVGLQGRYTFENSGALGIDTSPTASYPGTVSGTTASVNGTRDNVASFDGNDNIQITGRFGDPANVTLAAWVNLSVADIGGSEVISIGGRMGLRVDESTGGRGIGGFWHDGAVFQQIGSGQFIAGTGWHHVAFTFDDTNNTATVYLDGVAAATTSTTVTNAWGSSGTSRIGAHNLLTNTNYDFTGLMDDVRVYNRALNATEIATLSNDLNMRDFDTVAITINAVNDAPVNIIPSNRFTPLNTPVTFPVLAVMQFK